MRLLVTADLHYNHARSKPLANDLIDQMNQAGGDVLIVVGDTASSHGDYFERCLSRFNFNGPKLLVAGNHELWSQDGDSYAILNEELPRRTKNLDWHWLQSTPYISGDIAIVGSVGWYDYSLAAQSLGIPRRFYEQKISPGAAERFDNLAHLFNPSDDISDRARSVIARRNDGRYVRLGKTDVDFLDELLQNLRNQLNTLTSMKTIVAAIHHLPFRELLPPNHSAQWDFAKAYLGSDKIGDLLLQYPNISHLFSGHSHFPADVMKDHIRAINIGSGYRSKTFWTGEIGA